MKLWVLIGIASAAMAPAAFASEDPACPADSERQSGLLAPVPTAPVFSPVSEIKRAANETAAREAPPLPADRAAVRERQRLARPAADRPRKNSRPMQARIPDSVLIGGDGAL